MNHDFMRYFHDLLHSMKDVLPKELKRYIFINTLCSEVHVEVLKIRETTCDFVIAKCLAFKAIEI